MGQQFVQIDAFTDKPFRGNPAAVCLLGHPRDDVWMQAVASEMNLSETAYLLREGISYRLRWFTPAREVDLCGHATLASAHFLYEAGYVAARDPCRFLTRSGTLTCRTQKGWIIMDFPAQPAKAVPPPAGLAEAVGAAPVYVGENPLGYLLAELEPESAVRQLRPDYTRLAELPYLGFIVTARSGTGEFDFVSRFFAPKAGINEDPATGSSHCTLGPYWRQRLRKDRLFAYQASPRGGIIGVTYMGDRVQLRGQAVTVLRGELI